MALSGEGADELFGGYQPIWRIVMRARFACCALSGAKGGGSE